MRQQRGFSLLFFLFGLIFFAAGMGVGVVGFTQLYKSIISSGWDQVPMTILAADLEVNHDEDSTTYNVTARYIYQYQGQQYENDRVSFSGGSDNIGSFHQDTYQQLRKHLNGEPFLGYVNPEKPHKSVLIRKMRWGLFAFMLIFPVLFGGVGLVVMIVAIAAGGKVKKQQQFIRENPDREWQVQKDWRSNRLECSNKGMMWFVVIFAAVWNLISLPVLFFLPEEVLDKGNHLALLGLAFPLVGVGMIIWAVKLVKRWRRYGRSIFSMEPFPAHPGGIVRGTLELQAPLSMTSGLDELLVSLSHIRKYTTGSGKNRSTRESILWQDQQSIPLLSNQKHIQFGFKLDDKAELSDYRNRSDQRLWKINCFAKVPGVDFSADFEVPVIAGEPDAKTRLAAEQMVQHQVKQARLQQTWKDTGVEAGNQGGYPSYLFAAGRNKTLSLAFAAFGVVFGGIGFGTLFFGGLWLFGGIFALVGVAMLWGTLYFWLHASEFTVKPDRLILISKFLTTKRREFLVDSIQSIELKAGSQVNSQQYWRILLTTKAVTTAGYGGYKPQKSKSFVLATDIKSRRAAQALIDRIKKQMRLDR